MKVICKICDFELFSPIVREPVTTLGLYDDARFRGRSILLLNKHFENIEELPTVVSNAFMEDIKLYVKVLKNVLNVSRVNVSILGNSVPHIHAHLIPRYPEVEKFPGKSPWNDPRPLEVLPTDDKKGLINDIKEEREGFFKLN